MRMRGFRIANAIDLADFARELVPPSESNRIEISKAGSAGVDLSGAYLIS
jgi:hypothetical protein